MTEKEDTMKKSFKLITILLVIICISFQYSIALKEQKLPPSPDWSRSIETDNDGSKYFKLQSVSMIMVIALVDQLSNNGIMLNVHTI